MTLSNLKLRLDIEKARGNSEQVKLIEERIGRYPVTNTENVEPEASESQPEVSKPKAKGGKKNG